MLSIRAQREAQILFFVSTREKANLSIWLRPGFQELIMLSLLFVDTLCHVLLWIIKEFYYEVHRITVIFEQALEEKQVRSI